MRNLIAGVFGFLAIVCILIVIFRLLSPQNQPVQQSPAQHSSEPTKSAAQINQEFIAAGGKVIKAQAFSMQALGNGSYKVELNGRLSWMKILDIRGPAEVTIVSPPSTYTDNLVHSSLYRISDTQVGGGESSTPAGLGKPPTALINELPAPNADYYALVGKIDDGEGFTMGFNKIFTIPEGIHTFYATANVPTSHVEASQNVTHTVMGGYIFTITISVPKTQPISTEPEPEIDLAPD